MTDIDDTVVNVRCMVADVQPALDFYTTQLGFTLTGPGCQQVLLEDPSGNPIELFVPTAST